MLSYEYSQHTGAQSKRSFFTASSRLWGCCGRHERMPNLALFRCIHATCVDLYVLGLQRHDVGERFIRCKDCRSEHEFLAVRLVRAFYCARVRSHVFMILKALLHKSASDQIYSQTWLRHGYCLRTAQF